MSSNPIGRYQKVREITLNGPQRVLELYRMINSSLSSIISDVQNSEGDPQLFIKLGEPFKRIRENIVELSEMLDMEKGGHISENLLSVYTFTLRELSDIQISKEYVRLKGILHNFEVLYQSWKEIFSTPSQKTPGDVNLEG